MTPFSFIHPGILAGVLAVGLPVLIHYLTKARPRKINYPTLKFLIEAGSGKQSLHRLKVWTILTLRCLAVLGLILLFSRPFLQTAGGNHLPGASRNVVLVIDASASMQAVQEGISLFKNACAEAADILRSLEPGSNAGVIFMGREPLAALPALSENIPALHEALVQAVPTNEKGNPESAIAMAAEMLNKQGSLYIFSDFQKTNWTATNLKKFKGVNTYMRPVISQNIGNIGVTQVKVSPREPLAGESIEVICTVFNCSQTARQETVRLDLEGIYKEKSLSLKPYHFSEIKFKISIPEPGVYPGKISLLPDNLLIDNERFFKVKVRDSLKVLIISDSELDEYNSAAFFVEAALAPENISSSTKDILTGDAHEVSGLSVIRRHSQDIDSNALQTADTFVIISPATLPVGAMETLTQRVSEGAQLICMLDGSTSPGLLKSLSNGSQGIVSAPFDIIRRIENNGEPFSSINTSSGPLQAFENPAHGDLTSIFFRRHFLTEIDDNRALEVLAYFADGSCAISLSNTGNGNTIFTNFSLAPKGGTLVGSPLFPAFMHELIRALRSSSFLQINTPGAAWTIEVPIQSDDKNEFDPIVTGPDGIPIESTILTRGRTLKLALAKALLPGHYRVTVADKVKALEIVNLDAAETDTREIQIESLLSTDQQNETGHIQILDHEGEVVRAGNAQRLWPWFAGMAVIFLASETLLLAIWRKSQ